LTLKPRLGIIKVIGIDTDRSATCDFLLTFHSNQGIISYRFQVKWQFQLKINFFIPVYFAPPLNGFLLELVTGTEGQKTSVVVLLAEKEVWRYLQPCGYNPPACQTGGHQLTAKSALMHSIAQSKAC